MSEQFWTEVESIFADIVTLPVESRPDALRDRCGARADVRSEVESLLAADSRAEAMPSSELRSLDRGDVIGAFLLSYPIGHGGMGRVFVADRIAGGFAQRTAVKLIDAHGRESLRRFEAERQILAGLSHPNIVSLLDGGVTAGGQPYLVMEYVEGLPIDEYCSTQSPPLAERLRLCASVCSAVHYAHARGVIHRDLKPGNILVTPDGAPKVLDFGIAKLTGGDSQGPLMTAPGLPGAVTINYASPEQLRGLPISPASDIYSLGVVCHEVLLGSRPYELTALPFDEVIRQVLKHRFDPASSAPVDAIVRRAMNVRPEDRYPTAEDLQHALEQCANTVSPSLVGAGVVAKSSVGQVRSRTLVAGLAVIAMATVAVFAWSRLSSTEIAPQLPQQAQHADASAVALTASEQTPSVAAPERVSVDELETRFQLLFSRATDLSATPQEQLVFISEALTVRKEILRLAPGDPAMEGRLAMVVSRRALIELSGGNIQAALATATEAVERALRLIDLGYGYKTDAAFILFVRGRVERAGKNEADACKDLRRARDLHLASEPGLAINPRMRNTYELLAKRLPVALESCGRD